MYNRSSIRVFEFNSATCCQSDLESERGRVLEGSAVRGPQRGQPRVLVGYAPCLLPARQTEGVEHSGQHARQRLDGTLAAETINTY